MAPNCEPAGGTAIILGELEPTQVPLSICQSRSVGQAQDMDLCSLQLGVGFGPSLLLSNVWPVCYVEIWVLSPSLCPPSAPLIPLALIYWSSLPLALTAFLPGPQLLSCFPLPPTWNPVHSLLPS